MIKYKHALALNPYFGDRGNPEWVGIRRPGKEIKIPAKTVVKIRPAKAIKEAIVPSKK